MSLTKQQREILEWLIESGTGEKFYLAGGTALSIKYNHRFSEDFDFFTENFDRTYLEKLLLKAEREIGKPKIMVFSNDTLLVLIKGVKCSFFEYPYKLIRKVQTVSEFPNLQIASDEDIATMKASAISSRGEKKDFFDLWFLMRKHNWRIGNVIELCKQKFRSVFPEQHFFKIPCVLRRCRNGKSPP